MTTETKKRIAIYKRFLPRMREKVFAAGMILVTATVLATTTSFAWVTLSRAPAISNIQTTLASNGSLEIALAKADGSQPDEFDIDESVGINTNVAATNLTWGNLINLYDPSYGIDNLALRPAELNEGSLLTSPLKAAVYGSDGRVTTLNSDYSYAYYDSEIGEFKTSKGYYGVRAIASYTTELAEGTQAIFNDKKTTVDQAMDAVNTAYDAVPSKFAALGTMLSCYAQAKVEESSYATGSYSTNPDLGGYLQQVLNLYKAINKAYSAQKDAYVALANFQSYAYTYNNGGTFTELTWDDLVENKAAYNAASATATSTNEVISLAYLTQFISDYTTFSTDYSHLKTYCENHDNSGTAYYWSAGGETGYQISDMLSRLVNYPEMTIDVNNDGTETKVTALQSVGVNTLLSANGESRKVYVPVNSIMGRFEQYFVKDNYRMKGRGACTISISASASGFTASVTIYGKAYTKASGTPYFATNVSQSESGISLVANDSVAEDTYGMAVDIWLRTNAESTCLTLEGAKTTDEQGNIISYDGINRIWGADGTKVLTTESTTQGGGSFYVYYADTPEDYERSKQLLDAMKVAFVDETGNLLATASMDVENILGVNGRYTVPMKMDSGSGVSYTYHNDQNEELTGRAITTLYNDIPIRLEVLIYLDGAHLQNNNVLADATIQGQLNIQFGSSEDLTTTGANDLKDDTRSVSATVTNSEMDYDNAVSAADLTTDVTIDIDGVDPNTVTAFFLRAISSTQGSRESTMTFTKQANGKWTSSYKFEAPGTYYLRYVRLDGIDYALTEPQKIVVSGFALKSVSWGESTDAVSVMTSRDTYQETVSVEFATSDRTKMPAKVEAQFMDENGNTNRFSLTYSSATGKWSGTGTFQTSGTHTFSQLLFDGKYKDLEELGLSKKLNLNLGLYAVVSDKSGKLEEEYESEKTFERTVAVKIYDNSGTELTNEKIPNAKLYYSNGGSSSNTINATLEWNHIEQSFNGTLGIVKAGRYSFSSIQISGGSITKVTESPTYRIYSPDPPTFDQTSQATYNTETQFAPMTNDATIDGLKIANSESAVVNAVVYNSISKDWYELTLEDGDLVYTGSSWIINLPTYTLDVDAEGNPLPGATYTQEGTWSLLMLSISECFDASGNERTSEKENPIIWADTGSAASAYLNDAKITKTDARYSFNKLSTTVSCTVKVQFVPGTTALGSSGAAFMTHYPVDSTDMYALITDESGNIIPASKITNVELSVTYAPPTESSAYGYKVLKEAGRDYTITLNSQDAEDGHRTVDGTIPDWQYVGEYKVTGLEVNIGGNVLSYAVSDNIGLPSQYTVTTAGPSDDNIELLESNVVQRNKVIGKTGDTVTATFLQGGDPGVTAKITLKTTDNSDTRYVSIDGATMQLVLTYQGGSQANGGYTFTTGTSQYESITMNMTNNSGTYQTGSTPLLAGAYTAQLRATVGSAELTKNLSNISVYSKQPTLTITGVDNEQADEGSFKMDANTETPSSENQLYYYDIAKAGFVKVQNYYTASLANVYIAVSSVASSNTHETHSLCDYTLPTVTVSVADLGSAFSSASIALSNDMGTFEFTPSALEVTAEIGKIGSATYSLEDGSGTCSSTETITYETRTPAGLQVLSSMTVVDGNNTSYTISTTAPITIKEVNTAPPAISYAVVDGYTTPAAQASTTGDAFQVTLPTTIGTTQQDVPKTDDSVDWTTVSNSSQNLEYIEITYNQKTRSYSKPTCGSATQAQWTIKGNHHLYTRTTLIEEKTATTRTYRTVYGLTGWIINGVTYAPGQTITVDSVVTATPVIGVLSETGIGTASVTTTQRTTITDTSNGTQTINAVGTGSGSSATASESAAKTAAETKAYALVSGYSLFDSSDRTVDGHYATPQVTTVTKN